MATGSRGGWSNPLLTINLMNDPKAQASLSQGLRLGAMMAHRQTCMDRRTGDARNLRRSIALGHKARVGR
jgi:hypothetical protein